MNIFSQLSAVVVATIVYMAIGYLWYGPLFGKAWMRSVGIDPNDEHRQRQMRQGMKRSMTLSFIGSLITAFILSLFIINTDTGLVPMLVFAILIWLGFVATTSLQPVAYENKSFKTYVINNGYNLVSLLVMAAILSLWP